MPRHHVTREITLERREPERAATITFEDELYGAIAEPTQAVIEEHRSVDHVESYQTGDWRLATAGDRRRGTGDGGKAEEAALRSG